jgi:hypothetical protein
LGGVTRRLPQLRFAFIEGGVGWASELFGDLIEHRERRSAKALERMHPDKLDRAKLLSLVEKYGCDDIAEGLARARWPAGPGIGLSDRRDRQCRRFLGLQDQPQGGLGRALRQAILLRLRGGRPDERHRLWPQPVRRQFSTPSSARISGIST